jgi:hypothetical protein
MLVGSRYCLQDLPKMRIDFDQLPSQADSPSKYVRVQIERMKEKVVIFTCRS